MVLQAMRRRDPRQAAKVGGYEDGGVVEEGLDFGAPQANMRRKLRVPPQHWKFILYHHLFSKVPVPANEKSKIKKNNKNQSETEK